VHGTVFDFGNFADQIESRCGQQVGRRFHTGACPIGSRERMHCRSFFRAWADRIQLHEVNPNVPMYNFRLIHHLMGRLLSRSHLLSGWAVVALCGLLLASTLGGGLAHAQSQPLLVELHPDQRGSLSLQGRVGVVQDPTGEWTLADIRSTERPITWDYPPDPLRPHGPHHWWLKIEWVQTPGETPWILAFPTTAIRDIEFHGPFGAADGQARLAPVATGLLRPYASRPLGQERIAFPLDPSAHGLQTLYVRVQNTIAQDLTPTLWPAYDYLKSRDHNRLIDGIIYGLLLTLLVYNLALTMALRDRAFSYYVLACAAALLTLATFNGHTARYLWPDSPWWIEHSYVIWPALWLAFGAGFARAFLDIASAHKWADRVVLFMAGLAVLSLVLGAAGWTAWAQRLNEVLGVAGMLVLGLIALWIWRQGNTMAAWYLLAKLTLFLAVIGVALVGWGWWHAPFVLTNGLEIGIAAEMLVFAVALSARIRRIQHEKTVLRLRAAHLAQTAMTDPLTGLANRRGLTKTAQPLLAQAGQHAVLLFDLDRFKPINDSHGHEVGDQVLVEIGKRLAHQCRPSDVAARLGGDEFVVVMAHCPDRPALDARVEALCNAVGAPVEVRGQVFQISASVGVAITTLEHRDLTHLLRLADQAMYQSKSSGTRYTFAAPEAVNA